MIAINEVRRAYVQKRNFQEGGDLIKFVKAFDKDCITYLCRQIEY